jgi:hypothetical protein
MQLNGAYQQAHIRQVRDSSCWGNSPLIDGGAVGPFAELRSVAEGGIVQCQVGGSLQFGWTSSAARLR